MDAPPDDPVAIAGRDPEVVEAAKILILESLKVARETLLTGSPDAKQRIMNMYAGAAVKEVLQPKSGEGDESALLAKFHEMRRATEAS
jgi:hypothetical protein